MFCDRCGLQFLPRQSVCTRCGQAHSQHWLQLFGLLTIFIAIASNTLLGLFLLPRLAAAPGRSRTFFHAWIWFDTKSAMYGWAALALALLAWDYLVWRGSRPKVKGWVTRKILTLVLAAAVTPFIPAWLPAGQVSNNFLSAINKYPGLPPVLAWAAVFVVTALLCMHSETRETLLGRGRALSLAGISILTLVMAMTMFGWLLSYR
ncbi:MAG TPA: hypothetical protein VJN21_03430 [Candidatus Acidoferrales bacterium]|nr:hypothetical protein [Candidatus Acidoferrales bacterium]